MPESTPTTPTAAEASVKTPVEKVVLAYSGGLDTSVIDLVTLHARR